MTEPRPDLKAVLVPCDAHVEGDKRQRAPYILHWTCPSCGTAYERNYASGDYYLSYPTFGAVEEEDLYCGECYGAGRRPCDFTIRMRANITLEIW